MCKVSHKPFVFNGCSTSNVWLPSVSCLRSIRTCFSFTCLGLDENDGNERGDLRPCFCSYCTGEKGVAYTLLTSADQNFSGDLVRNLVSGIVSFGVGRLSELDI